MVIKTTTSSSYSFHLFAAYTIIQSHCQFPNVICQTKTICINTEFREVKYFYTLSQTKNNMQIYLRSVSIYFAKMKVLRWGVYLSKRGITDSCWECILLVPWGRKLFGKSIYLILLNPSPQQMQTFPHATSEKRMFSIASCYPRILYDTYTPLLYCHDFISRRARSRPGRRTSVLSYLHSTPKCQYGSTGHEYICGKDMFIF